MGRAECGPWASAYYLGAWLLKSELPQAEHRAYKPTDDEVRSFAQNHASSIR